MFLCLINQITLTSKLQINWDLKRQNRDILLSVNVYVCVHVCVCVCMFLK